MDKSVFLINPPEGETPPYYVIRYTNGGLGGSSRSTVIGIHKLIHKFDSAGKLFAYQGVNAAGDLITEFPAGTTYLVVRSDLVKALTPVEAAKMHKEEEEEVEKALGPLSSASDLSSESFAIQQNKGYL